MTTGAPSAEVSRAATAAVMLEREAEMATLVATIDAARAGDGRMVVVEGSAGIGKTRLLAEARALATASGFEVLTARGGELEGEFAFGIVRQLFEVPLAAATPELRAELLAGAAELSASLFTSAPTSASRGRRVVVRDAARPLLAGRELRRQQADAACRRRRALGR